MTRKNMKKVVVIDTCVLRYALEAETGIKSNKTRKKLLKTLLDILKWENIVVVFNTETIREHSKHIEVIRREIKSRSRINPSFKILRMLNKVRRKVPDKNFDFEFESNPVGRKDLHLLNSAKSGALQYKTTTALVITIAEDVYRGKTAKNGEGVEIILKNLLE